MSSLKKTAGFPRRSRLARKQDFHSVFTNSRKIKRNFFFARFKKNNLPHPRIGIVISKTAIKQAVKRNLFRRVVRESFRNQLLSLKPLDIVIVMRSECTPHETKSFREDVDQLWTQLNFT